MSFFEELKRRNVVRVGIAYAITSWVLLQVVDLVLEQVIAPDWVMKVFMLTIAIGFPVALLFAWAFEMTPEGLKKEKDIDRSQSISNQTGRKLDFAIIGVLVLAVVLLLIDRFSTEPVIPANAGIQTESSEIAILNAPDQPISSKSVAVLPFVNMSSDPEQEYFSDGISEEILNALARVKGLKVAGRTSSFAYKGKNQDLRQIGAFLGVAHILEGSVRKSGSTVRITAQLVQVEDGFHLWSDVYDRELTDVFAIQDEISTAILEQLKAHLMDGEQIVIATTRANSEAYDLYLLAKQRIYERTGAALGSAAELLDEAIAIDPNYASAYAQRGITALLLSDENYGSIPADQAEAQAKLYLDQALRLDSNQAEALAGQGLYLLQKPGQTDAAIEVLEKSLSINPNLVNAANWLQQAYGNAGRLSESIQTLEMMAERDPLYRPGIANLNGIYLIRGQYDKALAQIEHVRPFMPNDPFLLRIEAGVHLAQGHLAKGLRAAEAALSIQPENFSNRGIVGFGLIFTAQFERLLDHGIPGMKVLALLVLDRNEEATILAQELADSGENVNSLIGLLANSGKEREMIRFFEDRWSSLNEFERDYPILGTGGVGTMLDIAYAYSTVGNQERFNDAMNRSRAALDATAALGVSSWFNSLDEANYWVQSGDQDAALAKLEEAVESGFTFGVRISRTSASFKPLEGNVEFEAIQARMIEHLNAERAKLDLEPVTI